MDLRIGSYRLVDSGTRDVKVKNDQYRFLVGAKGEKWGWDWDSAVLYNEAKVKDAADGVDSRLFQEAVNRTDSS